MANKVAYIIELQNRFSAKAKLIKDSTKRMASGFADLVRKAKNTNISLEKLSKTAKGLGNKLSDAGQKLFTRLTLPLGALGAASLVQSSKLEVLATSFETMTGSAEKGKALLEKLTTFTATTPFQLEGVAKSTKALLAFKVPLKDMLPTLRMLGDIAAGTDAPLSEIALIFGKTRAKGKLMTEELGQFAERGIPIIDELAKKFKLTKAQVFKLASESKISFQAMKSVLKDLTSEGGIFFNQTKRQSVTLSGLWSTLLDNIGLTLGVIGDVIVEVFGLKNGISDITIVFSKLREKIKAFAKEHPTITTFVAVFISLLAVLGPILIAAGQMLIVFGGMAFVASLLGTSLGAVALAALPVVAAIGLIVTAVVLWIKRWEDIKSGTKLIFDQIVSFILKPISSIDSLGQALLGGLLLPLKAIMKIISTLFPEFGEKLKGISDIVIQTGQTILDRLLAPIQFVFDKIAALKRKISGFFGDDEEPREEDLEVIREINRRGVRLGKVPSFAGAGADIVPLQRSQADVNINLRAPEKTVESINRRANGSTRNLNVGVNMEPMF